MAMVAIGPFDVYDATTAQLDLVTEAWSYCTFNPALFLGRIKLYFRVPAYTFSSGAHAWGYTKSSLREIEINPNKSNSEQRYTIIHELAHMVDADKLNASSKSSIDLKLKPDFGYYDQTAQTGWSNGPYQYKASECFAHNFAKVLYVSSGFTWQNVLNTYYKRSISSADAASVRTTVDNSTKSGTITPDIATVPVGETRSIVTTKDATAIITNTYVPADTSPGTGNWNSSTMLDGFNGNDAHHPVGSLRGTGWEYISRAFVYFPISFTGAQTVDSGIMWLRQRPRGSGHAWAATGGSITIKVYRMTKDFSETPKNGESLWRETNNNTTNFRKTAQRYSSVDNTANWTLEGAVTKTFTQEDNGWVPVDISDIVTAWYDNSKGLRSNAPNYGVIIVANSEKDQTMSLDFFSREASDTTSIPYIDVTINANTSPSAPINLAPTGNALKNTLTPAFTGQNSDPDAGDYISAVQVKVFKNDGTTPQWDSGTIDVAGSPTTFSVTYGQQVGIFSPVPLVGNSSYKWQARTADKAGAWSTAWSALQQFKVNTPPLAASVTIVETPTNDVPTSTPTVSITHNDQDPGDSLMYGYKIQVQYASTVIYDGPAVSLASIDRANTKRVTLPTLAPPDGNPWGKSYRVKAQTKDSNDAWGAYSAWFDFTTHKTGVPINLDPTGDNIIAGTTPTFIGQRASTTDTIESYRIILFDDSLTQIWDAGTLTTGITNGNTFSKTYAGSLSSGTFYQWKALLTSSVGGVSDYSTLQRFRTPSDVTVPTQTAPLGVGISGGTGGSRPAFTGERATTFNRYQVEVYPSTANAGNMGTYTASTTIVDATRFWAPTTFSATIAGSGPYTFSMAADTVPVLAWGVGYKWRARVSSDTGATWSGWSGLSSFTMDVAATPTLTTPVSDAWITTPVPTFRVTAGGTDIIDKVRLRVYAANSTTQLWDSTMVDVTDSTAGGYIDYAYAGPTLTGGYYWWDAQYQKSTGPTGAFATKKRFRLNFAPDIPTSLAPAPGAVLEDTLTVTFEARFSDQDVTPVGDTPSSWEIIVESVPTPPGPSTVIATIFPAGALIVGVNTYDYDGSSTLSYTGDFQWKTRFADSKGVWGSYSGYRSFKPRNRPNSTNMLPSNTSTVNTLQPSASWQYVAGTSQKAVHFIVYEVLSASDTTIPPARLSGVEDEILVYVGKVDNQQSGNSYTFGPGLFQSRKVYEISLTVESTDGLSDPTPQVVRWFFDLDAPDPIRGFSPTSNTALSRIELRWDAPLALKTGHQFVSYNIYKRLINDNTWQYVDSAYALNPTTSDELGPYHYDYYAGSEVRYEYRVTIVTTKTGASYELESGDDPGGGNTAEAILEVDAWTFIGGDRSPAHILELPVVDEDHSRVIQQEAFEPLGGDRKVIIRGFVLGHEGSIQMLFENREVPLPTDYQTLINETVLGRRLLDYLTLNKGPHILKSPFGDVWDVQFEGPQYKWLPVGHLQISVSWIETGETSQVSI